MRIHETLTTAAFLLALAALLPLSFQSCIPFNFPLGNTETAEIDLPAPHPVLPLAEPGSVPSYTLRWYDAGGNPKERRAVTGTVAVELEKGLITPILLIPETAGGFPGTLPSAGGIYPLHAERTDGTIRIGTDWNRGIAAELLKEICESAADGFDTGRLIASRFNWTRFEEKLTLLANPLELDRDRIRKAVLSGKVTVHDVTALDVFPVSFAAAAGAIPEGSAFIPSWPGGAGFRWPEGNEITLSAPDGLTCYFSEQGVLVFQVLNGKQVSAFFRLYSLQD